MKKSHQILIIGGDTVGHKTAARLLKSNSKSEISLIEPADMHYYLPELIIERMLIFDSSKENWRLRMLKKYMLPYLYRN